MKILDFNDDYLLVSNQQKTSLLRCPSLQLVSECLGSYHLGSLQYSTGIVALGASSQVRFHDFKYERKLQQIETVLKLLKIKIIKNLLFCISAQRILIYDIATKNNLCHIPTSNGNLATISCDYYNLKLLYQVSENVYYEQQMWKNRTKKIQCIPCSIMRYDKSGQILCLVQDNVIALYQNQEIIRGCSFQDTITDVVPSVSVPHKFYAKTQRKDEENKVFYIEVSVANKFYLKAEQLIGEISISTEKEQFFEHKGHLMIWRQNKLYTTEIDLQPKLASVNQLEKEKKYELRISNVVENTAEEQRIEAQYLKDIEDEIKMQEQQEQNEQKEKIECIQPKQIEIQVNQQKQKNQKSGSSNQLVLQTKQGKQN